MGLLFRCFHAICAILCTGATAVVPAERRTRIACWPARATLAAALRAAAAAAVPLAAVHDDSLTSPADSASLEAAARRPGSPARHSLTRSPL